MQVVHGLAILDVGTAHDSSAIFVLPLHAVNSEVHVRDNEHVYRDDTIRRTSRQHSSPLSATPGSTQMETPRVWVNPGMTEWHRLERSGLIRGAKARQDKHT